MSIQTQIDRLQAAKADLIDKIEAKGVSVPADASLDDLAALVQAIDTQEDLSAEMTAQDVLIEDIMEALQGKAAGSGDAPVVRPLSVTENGTYTAPDGVDGYSPVVVDVPEKEPITEELSVTKNGEYVPASGVDGYSKVKVNVPDIPPVLDTLAVTENGTYNAPSSIDGYSSVTVNVPSENLDAEISEQATKINQLLSILDGKAAGGGAIEAWTGYITIYGALGGSAVGVYYMDEALNLHVITSLLENEQITIAANTVIFVSAYKECSLENASIMTSENDELNEQCVVIRPVADNFSIVLG